MFKKIIQSGLETASEVLNALGTVVIGASAAMAVSGLIYGAILADSVTALGAFALPVLCAAGVVAGPLSVMLGMALLVGVPAFMMGALNGLNESLKASIEAPTSPSRLFKSDEPSSTTGSQLLQKASPDFKSASEFTPLPVSGRETLANAQPSKANHQVAV